MGWSSGRLTGPWPVYVGSIPTPVEKISENKNFEKVAEWLKAADCKSVKDIFIVGSNPILFNQKIKFLFFALFI